MPMRSPTVNLGDTDVCVVAYARTPIGSFGGQLKSFSAVQLGALAIKGALDRCTNVPSADVDEVRKPGSTKEKTAVCARMWVYMCV
jgi:acetyl-CoA acetyltransferase